MRTSPYRLSRKLDFHVTEFYEVRAGLLRGASCPLLGKRHPQEAHQQQGGVRRVKTFWGSYGLPTLPAGQGQWGVYDVRGAPAFGGPEESAECEYGTSEGIALWGEEGLAQ